MQSPGNQADRKHAVLNRGFPRLPGNHRHSRQQGCMGKGVWGDFGGGPINNARNFHSQDTDQIQSHCHTVYKGG